MRKVSIKGDNASYSIKRATLIADQLERLATQNAHQLAGQFDNLAFWISEAVHAMSTNRPVVVSWRPVTSLFVMSDNRIVWPH